MRVFESLESTFGGTVVLLARILIGSASPVPEFRFRGLAVDVFDLTVAQEPAEDLFDVPKTACWCPAVSARGCRAVPPGGIIGVSS
jgi:hypothetical protein